MTTYTKEQFANDLGWNVKVVWSRLKELDLLQTCTRCGGSGRYSFNMMDGDRCYGCNGLGVTLPKRYTKTMMRDVKARQEAGELNEYFARCQRRAEARKAIAGLLAEAKPAYSRVGDAYSKACDIMGYGNVPEDIHRAQTLCNQLYWGNHSKWNTTNLATMSVREVEDACKDGKVDPVAAVAVVAERIAQLNAVADAWEAYSA